MRTLGDTPFDALLDAIASKTPTPGGGAVASAVGALAAALARMALSYSIGRRALAEHEPQLQDAARLIDAARRLLPALAEEDAAAYAAASELSRLPEHDPRRRDELPAAALAAIQAPRATIAACADLLRLFEEIAPITNRHLCSDLAIAAILAEAAARASRWNVLVNLPMLAEASGLPGVSAPVETIAEVDTILEEARHRLERIETLCA